MKPALMPFVPPLFPMAPPADPPPTSPIVLARALSKPLPPIDVAKALMLDSGSAAQ